MLILIKVFFNIFSCRRREWDMSEEAESTAELVKSLQRENTELCDKERRKVQDLKEREGDLEEKMNSNEKKENAEVIDFLALPIFNIY